MSEDIQRIEIEDAPKAIGPYSQGVFAMPASLIFVSGQLPIDPTTNKLIEGDIKDMTHRVLDNIEAILRASSSDLSKVVRVDIFLKDLKNDFKPMNEVYALRFKGPNFPARQTVQVSELPLGAPIEISCIALFQ